MGRYTILLLSLLCTLHLFATAQVNIANHWHIGDSINLDFTSGSPVLGQNSNAITLEGSATYSDANGNLLFYTNGGPFPPNFSGGIWNANHVLMDNGDLSSTNGCSSSRRGTFTFPDPKRPGIYHMMTLDCNERQYAGGLRYNRIDMNENGGLGKVVVKDSLVYRQPSNREIIDGVLNDREEGYWIYMLFQDTAGSTAPDTVVRFEVTSNGINGPFQQTINGVSGRSQAASPDRSKYLIAGSLFDITGANGQLSNQTLYSSSSDVHTVVFSPNSKLIYAVEFTGLGCFLTQYRVDTTDILASGIQLGYQQGFLPINSMQLGPDGKLYLLTPNGVMGIVACPNQRGSASNVNLNFMSLIGASNPAPYEFPAYPAHFFASDDTCGFVVGDIEWEEQSQFKVYPNPASGVVKVDITQHPKGAQLIRLRLLAMDGREIQTLRIPPRSFPTQLDLHDLPPGIYILEAQQDAGYFRQRLAVE